KPDTGRYRDLGFRQYTLGELQRSHGPIRLGNLCPDVHGCLGNFDIPTSLVQTAREHITTAAVLLDDLVDALLRAIERGNGRDLDGRKRTVVVIALDTCQGIDQLAIAYHVANAPASHIVAFAHG